MKPKPEKKFIFAIGGAVIKTARKELKESIELGKVEMLIHNGGSIFHDFQLAIKKLNGHSYSLDRLIQDPKWWSLLKEESCLVWNFLTTNGKEAPKNSITNLCIQKKIPILLFTGLGCDFWQLLGGVSWDYLAQFSTNSFNLLLERFKKDNFHFINLGSAVIHPEVFIKAIVSVKPKQFTAYVVDFLDMYRPKTRVSRFGVYFKMSHKEFLTRLNKGGIS